jgi:predicted ATPase
MLYLEKFFLPSENGREYPYQVLYPKMLDTISFSPITIFYGSNGSGKSTLLNVIAEKVYNLDMSPTQVCNWNKLENVRCYYDFFDKNKHLFS